MIKFSLKLAASVFAALLTFVAAGPAAYAQGYIGQSAKVNIPFAFEVGSAHLPAGHYTLRQRGTSLLDISGDNGSGSLMIRAEYSDGKATTGRAVFQRVGSQYFLTQLFGSDNTIHIEAVKTPELKTALKNERLLAQTQTQPLSQQKPDYTTIALR